VQPFHFQLQLRQLN